MELVRGEICRIPPKLCAFTSNLVLLNRHNLIRSSVPETADLTSARVTLKSGQRMLSEQIGELNQMSEWNESDILGTVTPGKCIPRNGISYNS